MRSLEDAKPGRWFGSSLGGTLAFNHSMERYAHWMCQTNQGFRVIAAKNLFEACVKAERDGSELLMTPHRSWRVQGRSPGY